MNHTLHFLSGLPRSGSTVLAAVLNQHPALHVSTTSGLVHALDGLAQAWQMQALLHQNDPDRSRLAQTMRGTIDAFYQHVDRPIIIDKARGWPIPPVMSSMQMVLERPPRIIATVRSVPDCMASFVRVARPSNLDEFMQSGQLSTHLKGSYLSLSHGYAHDPSWFLIVEYEDLVRDPQSQLARIHNFLQLPAYDYDFDNIDGESVKEDDEQLHGYSGMHDIQPRLARQHDQDPREVLGHHYWDFCQPEFWLPTPRTLPPVHDLDLQLAASTMGDFVEGWRLAQKLAKEEPRNDRAAYNRGWYLLRQGQIQQGYQLLDRGRRAGVFGDSRPDTVTEIWDGRTRGTLLLYLEGGLGDQIHQVRYAKLLADRGNRVIVCCSGSLVQLMSRVPGVSAVVQHGAEYGVFHDCYVPAMSAPVFLGLELPDLSGQPYIERPLTIRGPRQRIGLRWAGNRQFEAQHHKRFPADLLFQAVEGVPADFVSLQRDEDTELCPPWVQSVPLDSWSDTQAAVASCDLVISSCTSVAHLSGAMGVDTWLITPVMPYYLWAQDGERTPYYDSMRLFRQQVFGKWEEPFEQISNRLRQIEIKRAA